MKNHNKLSLFEVVQIESIQELLLKSSKTYANKLALEDLTNYPISSVTYSELNEFNIQVWTSIANIGLKPRDHIAVIGENRVQWAIAFLTAMMFDFVIIPVDKNLNTW